MMKEEKRLNMELSEIEIKTQKKAPQIGEALNVFTTE